MNNLATGCLAATCAALFSPLCSAQGSDRTGWYVGGELAQLSAKIEAGSAFETDDDAANLNAYGGYNFTPMFGLEGNISVANDLADDRENVRRAELSTVSVMPKLMLPATDLITVFAKAGLVFVDYTENYRESDSYWFDDASWNDLVIGIGLGIQFEVSPGVNLRLSYDYVNGELSEDQFSYDAPVGDIDVRLDKLAVGVHYQF